MNIKLGGSFFTLGTLASESGHEVLTVSRSASSSDSHDGLGSVTLRIHRLMIPIRTRSQLLLWSSSILSTSCSASPRFTPSRTYFLGETTESRAAKMSFNSNGISIKDDTPINCGVKISTFQSESPPREVKAYIAVQ